MNLPKTVKLHKSWIARFLSKIMPGDTTFMLFGLVVTTKEKLDDQERIKQDTHVAQYQDCIGLGFMVSIILAFSLFALDVNSAWLWILAIYPFLLYYIIYGLEWSWFRFVKKQVSSQAKRNIGFERQARWCASTWNEPCEKQHFYGSLDWWRKLK